MFGFLIIRIQFITSALSVFHVTVDKDCRFSYLVEISVLSAVFLMFGKVQWHLFRLAEHLHGISDSKWDLFFFFLAKPVVFSYLESDTCICSDFSK